MRTQALREASTPEWRYPEAKVVWALRGILAALFAYALLLNINPAETTSVMLLTYPLWAIPISFAFAWIPTRRPRTLKAAEALVLGALMLHTAGHALGLYETFTWYDKVLHFFNPVASVFVLFALSQATGWMWNWRRVSPVQVFLYVFSMAVTIGVLWEIIEFGMDELAGTREQNGLTDTMLDLIMDVAGALIGGLIIAAATKWGQDNGRDEIAESPKRATPTRAPGPGRAQ